MDENKIKRICAACNTEKSRNEFIKITVNKNKELQIMPNSKFTGRSTYICKNNDCIKKAFKKGKLYKILKIKPDETLEQKIRAVLEK